MFGKIFTQIFDSSLADNPQTRWVFMDMLVLADQNGVVDMTREAIARRTNVPLKTVTTAIKELESPDARSRSNDFEGVRLKRLDDHRDWGWVIVNYAKYRAIANAEAYRQVTREKVQAIRERARTPKAEAKAEAEAGNMVHVITRNNTFRKPDQNEMELHAAKIGLPVTEINKFFDYYEANGWRVGRNPMKNWQSAMNNWKRNLQAYGKKPEVKNDFWQHTKELELVQKELDAIRSRASHTAGEVQIEAKDRPAWDKLKARKVELKKLLNLK